MKEEANVFYDIYLEEVKKANSYANVLPWVELPEEHKQVWRNTLTRFNDEY